MPFEYRTDPDTREAATARVGQRLFTNPGDRSVYRVVSEEFSVAENALREWVAEALGPEAGHAAEKDATKGAAVGAQKKRRPRFSPVVRTSKAPLRSAGGLDVAFDVDDDLVEGAEPDLDAYADGDGDADADAPMPPPAPVLTPAPALSPASAPTSTPALARESAALSTPWALDARASSLEAEIAALRHDNGVLIAAMRVLLHD